MQKSKSMAQVPKKSHDLAGPWIRI